jgi:hypothetical protein
LKAGEKTREEGTVSPTRASSLPETDLARINRWVERENESIPPDARDQVRIEADVDDRSVTILECRPSWAIKHGFRIIRRHPLNREAAALTWAAE